MDPTDFFKTAELLKTHDEEAHIRTSIGRSYYSAFLYFRECLRSHGLEKKKQPSQDAHEFVIQCLGNTNIPEGRKASKCLHDLRQVRTDADYRLEKKFTQNDADDALTKAKEMIDNYKGNITTKKEDELIKQAKAHARIKQWI